MTPIKVPNAVWGPPMWRTMHAVALAYETGAKDRYRAFFESLVGVIPCERCRESFRAHLAEPAFEAALDHNSGGSTLFAWTVELHARVTAKTREEDGREKEAAAWTPERAFDDLMMRGAKKAADEHNKPMSLSLSLIGPMSLSLCLAIGFLVAAAVIGVFALGAHGAWRLIVSSSFMRGARSGP